MAPRDLTGHKYRTRRAIIKKRGDACHICGRAIDYTLKWPDPDSFSLDHVESRHVAPDRAFDLTNMAASHLGCNSRKADGQRTVKPRPSRDW